MLFSIFIDFWGEFSMGEYPCVGQRVGQAKFEFEINHCDRYVNQALVLQKSPLHPSLG